MRWVPRASWRLDLVRCLLFQSLPILKSTFTVVFGSDLTSWPLSAAWAEGHVGVENGRKNVTHAAANCIFPAQDEKTVCHRPVLMLLGEPPPLAHFGYTARRRNREKNRLAVTQYKPESAVDCEQSQCSRSQAFHPTRA